MKVWMYQRLWNSRRDDYLVVHSELEYLGEYLEFDMHEHSGYRWLCPEPNLVLVDRKYL